MALQRERTPVSPVVGSFCGFGFSFFFAAGWELFEFYSDVLTGGNAQNWMVINSEGMKRFLPALEPAQYVLMDTMSDLLFGLVGSILGGAALYVYIAHNNKAERQEKPTRGRV